MKEAPQLSHDPALIANATKVLAALPYSTTGVALEAVAVWRVRVESSVAQKSSEQTTGTGIAQGDIVLFDAMSSAGGSVVDSHFHNAYDSIFRCQVRLLPHSTIQCLCLTMTLSFH